MKPSPRSSVSPVGLIGAGALVLISLAITAAVHIERITAPKGAPSAAAPAIFADLVFFDEPDGSVQIRAADDRHLVERIAPATGGFVRGVMRGFARDRMMRGVGSGPPFELAESPEGRLTLTDLATGRVTVLDAFGSTNRAAFAAMLPVADTSRPPQAGSRS